jgi:hypothetical protein
MVPATAGCPANNQNAVMLSVNFIACFILMISNSVYCPGIDVTDAG